MLVGQWNCGHIGHGRLCLLARLQLRFHESNRMNVKSEETGIALAAVISPQLKMDGVAVEQLQDWLLSVLASSPSLKLHFNGRELQASPQSDA